MTRPLCIGIDVGGTFTDLFMVDRNTGASFRHKLSSTPDDPHQAPIRGIREILAMAERTADEVGFVGLGTTVATNALLERKGAPTGLITTRGFRDLLEIGRQTRPQVYDLFRRRAEPLVPRHLRLEVDERIGARGEVVRPIDLGEVEAAARQLGAQGVTSVAICFLNAYANPEHERQVLSRLSEIWPDAAVTGSQELVPEFREYERLSSTVTNAYLMPVMRRYLTGFRAEAGGIGLGAEPLVMSSSGGVFSTELAAERPIDTLLSGPSGGVSGAAYLARLVDRPNLVTFDMGGTSTDVCLVADGESEVTSHRVIDGVPIRSVAVDVHTVGAGGSSIAWIDGGGMLHVGPESAGAKPGPACYGRGGSAATMTDANVVLGRLNPRHLLGGALPIDARAASAAVQRGVAEPKRIGLEEAALAVAAISNTNIAQAIRFVSVERGLDPSDFVLVAFGGAGPLHAAEVARELGMAVLIPPSPGVLCAMGVLAKDAAAHVSRTHIVPLDAPDTRARLREIFAALEARAVAMLRRARMPVAGLRVTHAIEARYVGQNFELLIPVAPDESGTFDLDALRAAFDASHRRFYGYDQTDKPVELVTFRLRAAMPGPEVDLARRPMGSRRGPLRPIGRRPVLFDMPPSASDCPVFDREDLRPGDELHGPAIVEQMDTTTVIPGDFAAAVDPIGNLLLTRS